MIDLEQFPPVPFAIGMASTSGSPPFVALVFDDDVAVSLHAIRPLAAELGLRIPKGTLFDLLQAWEPSLYALSTLVQVLAYDDRGRGHRGHVMPEGLLSAEAPMPEARQIIRVGAKPPILLPVTTQTSAHATMALSESARKARPSPTLAAVIGPAGIAGWMLALELVGAAQDPIDAHGAPGTLALGPLMLADAFSGNDAAELTFGVMGRATRTLNFGALKRDLTAAHEALKTRIQLLPGDVLVLGQEPDPDTPEAGQIDTFELSGPGLGHARISLT